MLEMLANSLCNTTLSSGRCHPGVLVRLMFSSVLCIQSLILLFSS
uniref:Uncharacterized protein n=1 Tax=Rhizophora mucronata TaxID=61149 RepID=A0A2P2NGX3_RHIMU